MATGGRTIEVAPARGARLAGGGDMQIRDPGALTRDGCWEAPAASLARTQNGGGAGLEGAFARWRRPTAERRGSAWTGRR